MIELPYFLVLTGPTAVGKTDLLDLICQKTGRVVEVISADAFQVYRKLDIGTAKPSLSLQCKIPHHLIDIVDIHEQFSVGEFVIAAQNAIREITARGSLPVVCGGTVYYIKHLLCGMPETPLADLEVRSRIELREQELGLEIMRQELIKIDPISAVRIHANDKYRILRALEVWETSGRPLSSFKRESKMIQGSYSVFGLERQRDDLIQRIENRVKIMFAEGLADEFQTLISSGYKKDDPGMQAIGYQEFFQYSNIDEVAGMIALHSRQYAKRQMTFIKKLPGIQWLDAADTNASVTNIYKALSKA